MTSLNEARVTDLQTESIRYQLEAKLASEKVKELIEEGGKVMLKMDNLRKELNLSLLVDSETTYDYRDLEKKVKEFEQKLIDRAPDQAKLQQHLDDANTQLIAEN